MILGISQNFKAHPYKNINNQRNGLKSQTPKSNSCTPSFDWKGQNVSFSSWFASSPNVKKTNIKNQDVSNLPTTKYAQTIANSINKTCRERVLPQNLNGLMTPQDFRKLLPSLTAENFKSTNRNIRNGIYIADLDYEGNNKKEEFTPQILDKVAELSNQYYSGNRKPFVFALTNRDSIYSAQNAIEIIAKNPEKYKNMKFLPAIKLSMGNEEDGGIILYGINPFDEELIEIANIVNKNRLRMIFGYAQKTKDLHPEFSYDILEFKNTYGYSYDKGETISSLYRKARKCENERDSWVYVPESIKQEANGILEYFKKEYCSFDRLPPSKYNFLINQNPDFNKGESFDKYFTRDVNEEIVSCAKNTLKALVEYINKQGDDKPVMAISAPYRLSRYFEEDGSQTYDNIVEVFKNLKKETDGLICAFETVTPSYNTDITINKSKVEEFNDYIRQNCDLYEVGGSLAEAYKPIIYY